MRIKNRKKLQRNSNNAYILNSTKDLAEILPKKCLKKE